MTHYETEGGVTDMREVILQAIHIVGDLEYGIELTELVPL